MRTRLIIAFTLTVICSGPISAQSFGSFITEVMEQPLHQRSAMIEAYLNNHTSSPFIVNDTTIVLYHRTTATSVTVAGDANRWNPTSDSLQNIPGTNFWHRSFSFPPDTRLDYKFVLDGQDWILDPRNPFTSLGGFGKNSELRMPQYEPPAEIEPVHGRPAGHLIDTTIRSSVLGDDRPIIIYVPAEKYRNNLSGLLLVHDGQDFISFANMPTVLDNLLAEGLIPPVVAVFLPPKERNREYDGDRLDDHTAFVAREIIPLVRSTYGLPDDPATTVVLGASSGGNISLAVGMQHPELIGNIAAFSSNVIPRVTNHFASSPLLPLRVYLDIGTYDIPILHPRVSGLRDILEKKGYPLLFKEHHDGHSYANWRAHLDDALLFLLPR